MDGLHFITPPSIRGDPWFEDGNIVLLVEDDNQNPLRAFKVHRSVLARHSEVFQTMLDIPQPTPGTSSMIEHIDDCPVVRMYDHPNALSDLIKALYDGVCVVQRFCLRFLRLIAFVIVHFINEMWKISTFLPEYYAWPPNILLLIYASRPSDI